MTHPNLIKADIEDLADRKPRDASSSSLADALIPADGYGLVPLQCSRGHYSPIPIPGGWSREPWDFPARTVKDLKRDAKRFAEADAIGVIMSSGQRLLLDPSSRRLVRFVEHIDGSLR